MQLDSDGDRQSASEGRNEKGEPSLGGERMVRELGEHLERAAESVIENGSFRELDIEQLLGDRTRARETEFYIPEISGPRLSSPAGANLRSGGNWHLMDTSLLHDSKSGIGVVDHYLNKGITIIAGWLTGKAIGCTVGAAVGVTAGAGLALAAGIVGTPVVSEVLMGPLTRAGAGAGCRLGAKVGGIFGSVWTDTSEDKKLP
jgi:hypothetical protein